MNEPEKKLLVIAHALAHQENEIHYLKALLVEKMHLNIEEFQQEQDKFWAKTKHYRIYETLKTLQALQQDMESLPEDLNLDLYMDHLGWPSDPPEDQPSI
jgi:arginine deiminase